MKISAPPTEETQREILETFRLIATLEPSLEASIRFAKLCKAYPFLYNTSEFMNLALGKHGEFILTMTEMQAKELHNATCENKDCKHWKELKNE